MHRICIVESLQIETDLLVFLGLAFEADKIGASFIETSAMSGDNVEEAFVTVTRLLQRAAAVPAASSSNASSSEGCCVIL